MYSLNRTLSVHNDTSITVHSSKDIVLNRRLSLLIAQYRRIIASILYITFFIDNFFQGYFINEIFLLYITQILHVHVVYVFVHAMKDTFNGNSLDENH